MRGDQVGIADLAGTLAIQELLLGLLGEHGPVCGQGYQDGGSSAGAIERAPLSQRLRASSVRAAAPLLAHTAGHALGKPDVDGAFQRKLFFARPVEAFRAARPHARRATS